jgi:uncharacterized protein
MHYHIILTEKCNSQCRYCYEKSMEEFDNSLDKKFKFDFSAPCVSSVDLDKLKAFLEKDSDAVLVFYGGEPLLQVDKIKAIIDSLEGTEIRFRMQTNGKLLDKLPFDYLKKIEKILISIDGDKDRTDMNRGEGTFDKVIEKIKQIKSQGYSGELIARMTIAQDCPDLFEQVKFLVEEIGFTSIHWQLDVGFYGNDFNEKKISDFLEKYNGSLVKLLGWWVKEIKKGRVLKLYPFLGVVWDLLSGSETKGMLRCGAGHSGYCITTDGKISACPIMNNIEDFVCGSLDSPPSGLKKMNCASECAGCDYLSLCGGRCLYWRKAKLWPTSGDKMICDSIKFYIDSLKGVLPEIRSAIDSGIVSLKDFEYEKYFGPEIIP